MGEHITRLQRTFGCGRLSFKKGGKGTALGTLYQEGSAKIRLPKTYDASLEAVLINTAGGLTGGDGLNWEIDAGPMTRAVVTTQACEKIYKSPGDIATIATAINVRAGARLDWLPQETILFDRSALKRTLSVELEGDARFLALEAVMLGRAAMGEQVKQCLFQDRWRIRRDGRLIHADDVRLQGDIAALKGSAVTLDGGAAFASLLYCGSEDPETLEVIVDDLRENAHNLGIGVSAMDGKIVARFVSEDCYELRRWIIPFVERLRTHVGASEVMPKVWNL